MNFAQRLEELMQSSGITKYRISKAVGCSASTVTNWLNGTAPTGEYLQKISDFFGVSVDYLLGNEEKPAAPKGSELDELVKDELVGFYGDVKKELTLGDIEDIKTLMKIRAELNRQKGK